MARWAWKRRRELVNADTPLLRESERERRVITHTASSSPLDTLLKLKPIWGWLAGLTARCDFRARLALIQQARFNSLLARGISRAHSRSKETGQVNHFYCCRCCRREWFSFDCCCLLANDRLSCKIAACFSLGYLYRELLWRSQEFQWGLRLGILAWSHKTDSVLVK